MHIHGHHKVHSAETHTRSGIIGERTSLTGEVDEKRCIAAHACIWLFVCRCVYRCRMFINRRVHRRFYELDLKGPGDFKKISHGYSRLGNGRRL